MYSTVHCMEDSTVLFDCTSHTPKLNHVQRCPNLTHLLLDFSHGAQLADFSR